MKGLGKVIQISLLLICQMGMANFPGFGTYVGTLKLKSLNKEQLVKLELISSMENGVDLELVGILTLHFGSFKSGIYTNYHYDRVIYQPLHKTRPLFFSQSDQEVAIIVSSFNKDEIVGKLRANQSNLEIGDLVLKKTNSVTASLPIIQSPEGEYEGKCDGRASKLRIQAFRSTSDTSRVGNPFASYEIRGQRAEARLGDACLNSTGDYCTTVLYPSGSYNFFQEDLRLFGPHQNLLCKVTEKGLDCGKCTYVAKRSAPPKTYELFRGDAAFGAKPPASASGTPALAANMSSIEGVYKGYLHHEFLDAYQPASLNIITNAIPTSTSAASLEMSAVASLYFGGFDSSEVIPYSFALRPYPHPLLAPHFVFKRSENDVDAILQVTQIKEGEVRGIWYSILFGRVGNFVLYKDDVPVLPATAKLFTPISEAYESSDWELDLRVSLDKTPINTDNPFFPLALGGYFYHKDGVTNRIQVMGGSFNFYTGQIAIQMGKAERTLSGRRGLDKKIQLQMVPAVTMTPWQPFETPFRVRPTGEEPL